MEFSIAFEKGSKGKVLEEKSSLNTNPEEAEFKIIRNCLPVCSAAFKRQRRGMSIA